MTDGLASLNQFLKFNQLKIAHLSTKFLNKITSSVKRLGKKFLNEITSSVKPSGKAAPANMILSC